MRNHQGFTLLEVIVALVLVGLGVTALVGALSQNARTRRMTHDWALQEARATEVLMDELHRLESLRSEVARRQALRDQGQDALLGPWFFEGNVKEQPPGQVVALYRMSLRWQEAGQNREVSTDAALRVPQG